MQNSFCTPRSDQSVALHGCDLFRPAGQAVEIVEQFLGIGRDADEPLLSMSRAFRQALGAPAFINRSPCSLAGPSVDGSQLTVAVLQYARPLSIQTGRQPVPQQ